jgi:hypothetical protein
MSNTWALFGSLEGKGAEGFGGMRFEEKMEKSFKKIDSVFF